MANRLASVELPGFVEALPLVGVVPHSSICEVRIDPEDEICFIWYGSDCL